MPIIPRILVFAGSLRTGAYQRPAPPMRRTKELALQGAEVTRISLADYPLPIMDRIWRRKRAFPKTP